MAGQQFVKQLFCALEDPAAVRLLEIVANLQVPNYQQWIGVVVQNTGRFPWLKLSNKQQQEEQWMAYALWLAVQK